MTLRLSSKRSQKPKFQCLILKNGQTPEWLEAMELNSLGGCTTLSIGEFPNAGVESSLWQVLESHAPVKYYLSKKACEGIIRRAANRGKVLPKLLEVALLYRISTADNPIPSCSPPGHMCGDKSKTVYGLCSNSSNSMKSSNPDSGIYEAGTIRTLDSQGGNPSCNQGGMIIVESEQGERFAMVILNDQGGENMTVEKSDISPTLRSETHGHLPIVAKGVMAVHESIAGDKVHISDIAYALRSGRKPLILEEVRREAAGFDAIQITSKGNRSSVEFDTPYPTLCKDSNPHVITLHPEIAPTLTASAGGTSRPGGGQGSELDYYIAYSLQGNMIGRADHNGPQGDGINENSCFTLNATDQHAVAFFNHTHSQNPPTQGDKASCQTARQYKKSPVDLIVKKHFINTGMMNIKESEIANTQTARQYKGTTDFNVTVHADGGHSRYTEGIFGTLNRCGGEMGGGGESLIVEPHYIVRRLTPTECERLQGFPDEWTKYGADSGKEIADTPRYQMLGNSVAIPVVQFILRNIAHIQSAENPVKAVV